MVLWRAGHHGTGPAYNRPLVRGDPLGEGGGRGGRGSSGRRGAARCLQVTSLLSALGRSTRGLAPIRTSSAHREPGDLSPRAPATSDGSPMEKRVPSPKTSDRHRATTLGGPFGIGSSLLAALRPESPLSDAGQPPVSLADGWTGEYHSIASGVRGARGDSRVHQLPATVTAVVTAEGGRMVENGQPGRLRPRPGPPPGFRYLAWGTFFPPSNGR